MKPEPSSFCNSIRRKVEEQEKLDREADTRYLTIMAAILITMFAFVMLVAFP